MSNSYRVRIQLKFFSEHCQNTWLHQMYKYTNLHTKYICFGIAVYRVQCTLYMTFYLLHSLQRYFRRKIHNFLFCLNWCMYLKWWNILPGHHAEQWKNTIWFNRFRFSCRKKFKSMAQTIQKQIENHKSTCRHELQRFFRREFDNSTEQFLDT